MKKIYEVTVRYSGSATYSVEADSEDRAKEEAQAAFDEDGSVAIEANIDNIEYDVSEVPGEELTSDDTDEKEVEAPSEESEPEPEPVLPRMTPYERTRAAVYRTGNRWAIENFHATHG